MECENDVEVFRNKTHLHKYTYKCIDRAKDDISIIHLCERTLGIHFWQQIHFEPLLKQKSEAEML